MARKQAIELPAGTVDDFEFGLVGPLDTAPFLGYASAPDKTSVSPQLMIRGSKNIIKKLSGTLASREGLKLRGVVDNTAAKVDSSWEWNTWNARCLPLRISNGKLQVESDIVVAGSPIWYTLLSGLTKTRYVFDAWWDNTNRKDVLLYVNGSADLGYWSGAMALLSSANTNNVSGTVATMTLQAPGTGYVINDVLTIAGGTGATLTVNSVSGNGAITSFTLTTRGSGYSNTSGAATTGGTGTGATINITVATGQIGLDRVAVTAGFAAAGGSVTINGNTYTYASASASSLFGISPDPSAEPANSVVMDAPGTVSNFTPALSNYAADFCRVINNNLWVGSYTSRVFYMSKSTSYTDFSQSTPRVPGDGELVVADDVGKGIGVRQGNPWLAAGTSSWYEISFSQITVGTTLSEQTKVDKKPVSILQAALAHEFIDMIGDTLVALCQDQQLRQIGLFTNQFETKYPSLSLAVQDELVDEDFTGGHLRAVGDMIFITAPKAGRDYMYEYRQKINALGEITAEQFWHAPQIRNLTRIAVISGDIYGHSNSFPQIYQLFGTGQYHDDSPDSLTTGVPYDCFMRLAYQQLGTRRQGKLQFDKLYVEGYCTDGTKLYGNVYIDYQGATDLFNLDLNAEGQIVQYSGQQAPSLGDSSLGDNPLGDGLNTTANNEELLPKFRVIKGVAQADCFEYALEVYTQDLDSRWEVLAIGTNAYLSDSDPIEIVQ